MGVIRRDHQVPAVRAPDRRGLMILIKVGDQLGKLFARRERRQHRMRVPTLHVEHAQVPGSLRLLGRRGVAGLGRRRGDLVRREIGDGFAVRRPEKGIDDRVLDLDRGFLARGVHHGQVPPQPAEAGVVADVIRDPLAVRAPREGDVPGVFDDRLWVCAGRVHQQQRGSPIQVFPGDQHTAAIRRVGRGAESGRLDPQALFGHRVAQLQQGEVPVGIADVDEHRMAVRGPAPVERRADVQGLGLAASGRDELQGQVAVRQPGEETDLPAVRRPEVKDDVVLAGVGLSEVRAVLPGGEQPNGGRLAPIRLAAVLRERQRLAVRRPGRDIVELNKLPCDVRVFRHLGGAAAALVHGVDVAVGAQIRDQPGLAFQRGQQRTLREADAFGQARRRQQTHHHPHRYLPKNPVHCATTFLSIPALPKF